MNIFWSRPFHVFLHNYSPLTRITVVIRALPVIWPFDLNWLFHPKEYRHCYIIFWWESIKTLIVLDWSWLFFNIYYWTFLSDLRTLHGLVGFANWLEHFYGLLEDVPNYSLLDQLKSLNCSISNDLVFDPFYLISQPYKASFGVIKTVLAEAFCQGLGFLRRFRCRPFNDDWANFTFCTIKSLIVKFIPWDQ